MPVATRTNFSMAMIAAGISEFNNGTYLFMSMIKWPSSDMANPTRHMEEFSEGALETC